MSLVYMSILDDSSKTSHIYTVLVSCQILTVKLVSINANGTWALLALARCIRRLCGWSALD